VKVFRVRVEQFGKVTRCRETRVCCHATVTQTANAAAEENLRKQHVCTAKAQDGQIRSRQTIQVEFTQTPTSKLQPATRNPQPAAYSRYKF
jgi:hypothetical protein